MDYNELSICEIERIKAQVINELEWDKEFYEEEEPTYCCCIC